MDAQRLKAALAQYPCRELPNAEGQMNGEMFVTCPVRIAFAHLGTPKEKVVMHGPNAGQKFPEWSAALLIPAGADISPLYAAASAAAAKRFGDRWQAMGLNHPFRPQNMAGAKSGKKYGGFDYDTPGAIYLDTASQYEVPIYSTFADPSTGRPAAIDPKSEHVYSGMWAIALISVYTYPKPGSTGPAQQGVKFGLRQLQKIGDDDNLGESAGTGPSDAFAAVAGPAPDATHGFGGAPAAPQAPAAVAGPALDATHGFGGAPAAPQAPAATGNPAAGWGQPPAASFGAAATGDQIPYQWPSQ